MIREKDTVNQPKETEPQDVVERDTVASMVELEEVTIAQPSKKESPKQRRLRALLLAVSIGLTSVFGTSERRAAFAEDAAPPGVEHAGDGASVDEEIRRLEEELRTARQRKTEHAAAEQHAEQERRRAELGMWLHEVTPMLVTQLSRARSKDAWQVVLSDFSIRDPHDTGSRESSEMVGLYVDGAWVCDLQAGTADEREESMENPERRFSKIEFLTTLVTALEQQGTRVTGGREVSYGFIGADHKKTFQRIIQRDFLGAQGNDLLREHEVTFDATTDALAILDRHGYRFEEQQDGTLIFVPPRPGNGISLNAQTAMVSIRAYGSQGVELAVFDKGDSQSHDVVVINRGRVVTVLDNITGEPPRNLYPEKPVPARAR